MDETRLNHVMSVGVV